MPARCLVLFVDIPPYEAVRESPFLEAEFLHLCRRFDRVVLVPERLRGFRCALPPNVEVEEGWAGRIMVSSRLQLVAPLQTEVCWREIAERPSRSLGRVQLTALLSFVARAWLGQQFVVDLLARRGLDPSCTVAYSYWLDVAAMALVLARRRLPGLRVVSRAHGFDVYEERRKPPYLPCRGALLRGLDRIFFISEHGRDRSRSWPGFDSERHLVARLGVPEVEALSQGSSDGILRVVSCSYLVPVKRLDLLMRGMSELARSHPELQVRWRHLGEGPMRQALEALRSELRLPNLTVEFPGYLPNQRLADEYNRQPVDLFVNVSESEGIPVAIMEAQSYGIPVLGTDVGGMSEAVRGPGSALLPAAPTPQQIAAAAVDLARRAHPAEVREALRSQARERFLGPRNYATFAAALLDLLQDP